jgi:carbon-monoxide dehydrogenase large subunit
MSTTSCCRDGVRPCAALAPRPRENQIDRHHKAKAAPGVLCVLTGEDWIKSGWGDLPVPGTHKRRDGSTNYKPRYPALVKDRVRFVGDYVAFVVAETKNQAMDACELIEVDYEVLPRHVGTADAAKPGATLVWDDCKDNICFTAIHGDKAKTERPSPRPPMW